MSADFTSSKEANPVQIESRLVLLSSFGLPVGEFKQHFLSMA